MNKNVYQPYFLKSENRWVCGHGGSQSRENVMAVIKDKNAQTYQSIDIDSGLGIGGINNDQSMPTIPSIEALERVQRMEDTDIVCKRCHSSKNFDGAMFTTMAGSGICDDCTDC